MSVYDFTVKTRDGKDLPIADFKGKVLLIVNSATQCGFTPQYPGLQDLYNAYHEKGFEILDFPCNQFGAQAPGSNEDIHTFCTGRFGITFPQLGKIDVNGENADPLYKYLTAQKGFAGFDPAHPITKILVDMFEKNMPGYENTPDIKWNFTKFLVDKEGNVVKRYEPTSEPAAIAADIEALL